MKTGFARCHDCDAEFASSRPGADQCQECRAEEDRVYELSADVVALPFMTSRSEMRERLSVSGDVDE